MFELGHCLKQIVDLFHLDCLVECLNTIDSLRVYY